MPAVAGAQFWLDFPDSNSFKILEFQYFQIRRECKFAIAGKNRNCYRRIAGGIRQANTGKPLNSSASHWPAAKVASQKGASRLGLDEAKPKLKDEPKFWELAHLFTLNLMPMEF